MFVAEDVPERGVPLFVCEGIRRIVAPNASAMTYHGTNTYLVEAPSGVIVIDPGPRSGDHLRALCAATGRKVEAIFLTHGHSDHIGLARPLAAMTGARIYGSKLLVDSGDAQMPLIDGETYSGLMVLNTPGHTADHLCLRRDDGTTFTGDHVLSWALTAIMSPDGDVDRYLGSLERLRSVRPSRLLPGHGPESRQPQALIDYVIGRVKKKERQTLELLLEHPSSVERMIATTYGALSEGVRNAAMRSLLPFLARLEKLGQAKEEGGTWRALT